MREVKMEAAISKKQPLPQFREALRAAATPRTSLFLRVALLFA